MISRYKYFYPAFTLVEVLVVILLIGIIVNFVVINLDINNPVEELKKEAKRFTSLIQLASEEALLRSQTIGIAIDEDAYEFLLHIEQEWEPIQENLFRERQLPKTIKLHLITEQANEDLIKKTQENPDILILSSGELTPFELEISSILIDETYRISGEMTGNIHLEYVSNK